MLTLLGGLWALKLLVIKAVTTDGYPASLTALTASLGVFVLLLTINVIRGKATLPNRAALKFCVIAGLLGFGIPFFLEIQVAENLPVVFYVFIVTSAPIWTLALGILFKVEVLSLRSTAAILLGFVAAALILFAPTGFTAPSIPIALLLTALSIPIFYALNVLYVSNAWPDGIDVLQIGQWQSLLGTLIFFPIALTEPTLILPTAFQTLQITLIALSEAFALILFFTLARTQGGSFAAQANYIAIAIGALIGSALFNEPLTTPILIGIALLCAAIALKPQRA